MSLKCHQIQISKGHVVSITMSQRCEFTSPWEARYWFCCLLTYLTGRHDSLSRCFISVRAVVWLSEEPPAALWAGMSTAEETSVTRFRGNESPFMIVTYHSFAYASPFASNNALSRNVAPGNALECQLPWCRAAEREQPQPQETLGYDQLRCWEKLFSVAAAQTCRRTTEPVRHQRFASSNQHGDRVLQSADLLLFFFTCAQTPLCN